MSYVGIPDSSEDPEEGPRQDESWSAAEFQKRRGAFENVEAEELFDDDANPTRAKRLRELMISKSAIAPPEFGLSFGRPSNSNNATSSKKESVSPPSQSSWSPVPNTSSEPATGQRTNQSTQAPMNLQRIIDEDDDGLGISSTRQPLPQSISQRENLTNLNSSHGNKTDEQILPCLPYGGRSTPTYLCHHHGQMDENEKEDSGLSQQIEFLTAKNQQLQKQLVEREVERDRLREQLETQRTDKGLRFVCSPPGLPSRVLDGRKVLRDSVPLVTSPGIPPITPSSPHGHPHFHSPLPSPSPLRVLSPLPPPFHPPRTASPLPHSPHSHLPLQSSKNGESSMKQHGTNIDDYQLLRRDSTSSPSQSATKQYFQQVEDLKRDNKELEKRLHELSDEKRRLESDLNLKKESFLKMQAREQDLSKDIEILRDENSHHTGAIKRLQGERDGLKNENETLHDELTSLNDKLNKTEKCYKEVEHENLSLEAEIEQLVTDKKHLFEEKQKLQVAVESALKTKESYRSTIKQLREQNQSLEDHVRRQPSDGARAGVGVANRPKKISAPATREQKTLSKVMNLREAKLQLQGKLLSAQQEIDSLEAHLKIQESKDISELSPLDSFSAASESDLQEEISLHFSRFHSHVAMVQADLESARNDIAFFSSQQHDLVRESFLVLLGKCRELLLVAKKDKSSLSKTLQLAESSLSKMEEDYDILKRENARLLSQRDEVLVDVECLKDEISKLKDHEHLLAARLSQNEAIAQDKEEQINEIKSEKFKVEERYQSSEKKWKKVVDKLQLEWEGKEAELLQKCELLSEEKDCLLMEKNELEVKLSLVMLDNDKLTIVRDGLESQLKETEEQMLNITLEVDANERMVDQAREAIAELLAQKVCLSAQMVVTQENLERELAQLQDESDVSIAKSNSENNFLKESIRALESERDGLSKRLEEISGKEQHIDLLESKIAALKRSQDNMQSEMDTLTKKHTSVVREFQILEETEHSRRLNNEKLKMTLTTEIKLLRSKLSTVEDEKHGLERTLSEMSRKEPTSGGKHGAFHLVPSAKQLDQMKKHGISQQGDSKQQQRKGSQEVGGSSSRNASQINELQNRVAILETENKILKESAKKSSSTISSSSPSSSMSSQSPMDEEMLINLRKRVTEMTRKTFFLESDKHHLTDKVKTLTVNLKSARDSKNRLSTEHVQKLQAENLSLHERVRKLEESLTKKLMAADSKIVETVSENDLLREKLLHIQSTLGSDKGQDLQDVLDVLKNESEVLQELKTSLVTSSSDLDQLESGHQRIEGLQQELQLTLSALELESASPSSSSSSSLSSSGSRNMPSVFKSLPAGYLSNFQYRKGSSSPSLSPPSKSDSRSQSFSSSNPDLLKKMSEMSSATTAFGETLKKHKTAIKEKDAEVTSACERLIVLEEKFKAESKRSKDVISTLHNMDFSGEKLASVMKRQIENLQDQVMVRDSALSDIETQMKADFEAHHKKFTFVKSQVLELREQMSAMKDLLRSKDQYIHQTEEKSFAMENELFKVRKELDGLMQGQKEFVRQSVSEKMKLQGVTNVADVIRLQREEVNQLQKAMRDFTCDLSQAQSQLEATQREKAVLLSKSLELERMHVQMKEHMGGDIHYLRQLNLQLVERQMKADKATEILKEVKEAQSVFKKQRDLMKLESELDAAKIKVLEQNHRMTELESQLSSQTVAIKILHAEKEHSVILTHHTPPELTNQFSRMHMRPRSAESARKPKYKISDFKPRVGASGRAINSEFSIVLPSQNSRHGNMDILNLEEQPETGVSQHTLSLGPMVVTDDEYAMGQEVEKTSIKQQRFQRLRRGHRRTASTGSSIIPFSKEKDGSNGSKTMGANSSVPVSKGMMGGGGSNTLPAGGQLCAPSQLNIGIGGQDDEEGEDGKLSIKRPGSAGSTSQQIFHVRQESRQLVPTSLGFNDYAATPIDELMIEKDNRVKLSVKDAKETIDMSSTSMMDDSSSGKMSLGGRGVPKGGVATSTGGGGGGMKVKGRYDQGRNKPVNKSTDSNETTSSEGNGFSSKSSSQSDSSGHANHVPPSRKTLKRSSDHRDLENLSTHGMNKSIGGSGGGGISSFRPQRDDLGQTTDLTRTESMSSTCSTLSIYGNSALPSRNHSFTYDGGEESSTYESLEIGDSEENLQALGKLGYNPYISAIVPSETYTTSSSDDENYRKSRRKKSCNTTGDNTPRHRDLSYHGSNSSGESDALVGDGYRDNGGDKTRLADIPLHVNESISVSDMDRDATDIEMEQKAADLQQCFGHVRYSSTGSVKICYSESSMEDISKR